MQIANNKDLSPEWDTFDDIYLLAKFNNDLVSSYISGLTQPLTGFSVYRQKSGDTVLRKVGDVGKDGNSLIDHLIYNNEEYKWVVIPVTEEELGISMESAPILTDWHSWSISALSQISPQVYFPQETWVFSIDLSESELSQNVDKTIFKTNSQYPKISVGNANYFTGDFSCLFGNIDCIGLEYSESKEKLLKWREFVALNTPYLLKDIKGNIFIGAIHDNTEYYETYSNFTTTRIDFSFTETQTTEDKSIYEVNDGILQCL